MKPPCELYFDFLSHLGPPLSDSLVTLQLTGRGNREEAVRSGVVDQWPREKEPREEPAEGVALLLKEHQHPVHGLDTEGVVAWRR